MLNTISNSFGLKCKMMCEIKNDALKYKIMCCNKKGCVER
jgi:hypothetical protein